MTEKSSSVSFLFSAGWWKSSLVLLKGIAGHFFPAALILLISNLCSVYTDYSLRGGLELGVTEANQEELQKLLFLALSLLGFGFIGLITGLLALSLWMYELTALAKYYLEDAARPFSVCLKELKKQGKHLSRVWLFGLLYLAIPSVQLSILLSFTILAGSNISVFGEKLLSLPAYLIMLANLLSTLLFLVILDYSLILLVFSCSEKLSPKLAASAAAQTLLRQSPKLLLINVFLIFLDLLISAPFVIINTMSFFPELSKNLYFGIGCQFWMALASVLCWPLSLLIFAEFLKSEFGPGEKAEV